ncbi:MAG: hypothetical protein F2866_04625 [Actinobacteria bacterium]|nr:hypothetical protein [Actinomycetota bacterium]MSX44169.1 hypothetical protein [Actinomycetota bacterium]MSX97901.1 hypothetical protein [Actinomycetota bacterium]MTB10138.1 hypothetical protein [Actinomycetota bacterium]
MPTIFNLTFEFRAAPNRRLAHPNHHCAHSFAVPQYQQVPGTRKAQAVIHLGTPAQPRLFDELSKTTTA